MLKIHSEPSKPELTPGGPALLALGFRPFFAVVGIGSVALMLTWLFIWKGKLALPDYYGVIGWHSHEMLFGYAPAIIAGFLLTAVRNWTGITPPTGWPLAGLAALWVAGRLLPLLHGLIPAPLIALVDLLFLPAIALSIKPALWQGEQRANRIFVPLLLIMAIANLLIHLQSLGLTSTANQGNDMMLLLVVFLVALLGGRVIPFFTQAVVPGHRAKSNDRIDSAAEYLLGALILAQLIYPAPWLIASLATTTAIAQLLRVAGWHHIQVWQVPILWVLYSGFGWIIVGLLMLALASMGFVPVNLAKHALTVGGIGILTLGMISRIALGHTGRPIAPHKAIELTFILLNISAAVRVFAPMIAPERYSLWVDISGGLWVICFLIFSVIYLPIVWKPRIDGKPG